MTDLDKTINNHSEMPFSGEFEILSFSSLDALEEHAIAWNRLVEKSAKMTPMMSAAWIISYFEHRLDPNDSWACQLAFNRSILVGVIPVVIRPVSFLGVKSVRLILPYRADAIAQPGLEDQIIPLLLASIQKLFPKNCGLEMRGLRERFPSLAIYKSSAIRGKKLFFPSGHGLYFNCDQPLANYQSRFSENFNKNLIRINNKFRKHQNREFKFLEGFSDTDFDKFIAIESSGWKGERGDSIKNDPKRVNYYRALTKRLAQLGWLRWQFLEIDGQAVAAQMAVKKGQTLVLEKNGYDEKFKSLSPGTLLFQEMVNQGFDDDATSEIDCQSDFDWMNKWKMDHYQYFDLFIYPKKLWPLLTGYLPHLLKSILHSGPRRQR